MAATIYPRPLVAGDRIAILSPASSIRPDLVEGALEPLRSQGWEPVVMPHALGTSGSFSAPAADRLSDINLALSDPRVRAIICSRGGYGAVHLLRSFPIEAMQADPRWLVGFSDVSALHAMLSAAGIASIHASMCRHLTEQGADDADSQALFAILRGARPSYTVATDPLSRHGHGAGRLIGGNLAVLSALIATPYDVFAAPGSVLFIEDIAEPIYKVERILWQLRLNGALSHVSGLIVGQFTEYKPSRDYPDMYTMISQMVADLDVPVAFNYPVGHVTHNLPLIESAHVELDVTADATTLTFL